MTKRELEHKISILLSCKNCPQNKGGYICEKEYEGKCLSQKTQYIKELQDEIVELKEINSHTLSQLNLDNGELIIENEKLKKENAELKKENAEYESEAREVNMRMHEYIMETVPQLTEAKKIIKEYCDMTLIFVPPEDKEKYTRLFDKAEAFLKEVSK